MKEVRRLVGYSILVLFAAVGFTVFLPATTPSHRIPASDLMPYTQLELQGKMIYQREGCWYCHTQQVRPVAADRADGPISSADRYVYDRPVYLGSKRTGPDLANEGDKLPNEWHALHLRMPRALVPDSIMPSYAYLSDQEIEALVAYLQSLKKGSAEEARMPPSKPMPGAQLMVLITSLLSFAGVSAILLWAAHTGLLGEEVKYELPRK